MGEQQIQTKIVKYLKSLKKCWYVKTIVSNKGGVPDLLVCYRGYFIAIEVKNEKGGTTSPLQKYNIKQINKTGGVALVTNNLKDVKKVIKRLSKLKG